MFYEKQKNKSHLSATWNFGFVTGNKKVDKVQSILSKFHYVFVFNIYLSENRLNCRLKRINMI